MKTETIQIGGMSCEKCRMHVKKAILAQDGVSTADVSLEKKTAVIEYDTQKTNTDRIKKAIRDAGYQA